MDTARHYQHIIGQVLSRCVGMTYKNGDIQNELIFDHEHGRYVVMSTGWQGVRRIHGCLIHITFQEGKIWIQRDGTEHGIANDLVAAGIPRDQIVLGFYSAATRQHTEYAAA